MKSKLVRTLSLALCLVLLFGALPIGAMAATAYSDVYCYDEYYGTKREIYDGMTVEVDINDFLDSSNNLDLTDFEELFTYDSSDVLYIDLTFYESESDYSRGSSYALSSSEKKDYDWEKYNNIYCEVYVIYTSSSSSSFISEPFLIEFEWDSTSSSSSGKYAISATIGTDFKFDEDDFGISSKSYTLRNVYLYINSVPTYGTLYENNSKLSKGDKVYFDDIADGDLVYYCSSSDNSSKKADSFTFSVYNEDTGRYISKSQTMSISFSGTSSTSSKYSMNVEAGEKNNFSLSDFDVSATSHTDITFNAPKYGQIYDSNGNEISYYSSTGTDCFISLSKLSSYYYYYSSRSSSISYDYANFTIDKGYSTEISGTMYFYFDGSGSYSMKVTLGSNNYLDADDFCDSSSGWTSSELRSYSLYIDSVPSLGKLYDSSNSSKKLSARDEIDLSDLDDVYYYCSSSDAGKKTSDSMKFTIYNGSKEVLSGTFTFTFSSTSSSSSSSTDKDFYLLVTASKNNYLDEDDFEDPGYYGYSLSKYTASKVEFIVESAPSRGDLYDGKTELSKNDSVTLDDIDDIYYYCSSSSTTDSMTFSLYDNSSRSYLVEDATLYFVFNADTVKDFSKTFTAGKSVSFTQSDFTSNFTAGSSGSSLKYVKITALPSYGYLKLNSKTLSKGDVISYSDLGSLVYEPMDGSVTKDIFTYAATSSSYYSADATVTLSSAYTPTNYTVETSGSVVTVTFTSATPTSGAIAQSFSAEDVTYLISKASSGSTLLIKMPQSVNTSGVTRSISIDSSMFSTSGTSAYSRIILESTGYNASGLTGNNVYLMVPTSSVATLYNTYSGNFTMKEGSFSLADDDKAKAGTTPGMARNVNMSIGANSVSPEGATLSVPFNEGNNSDSNINAPVIMERLGYQSYQAVLSSTWSDTMPYLSTDDRPFVTCEVEGANKVYVAAINKQTYSDLATTHWGYSYIQFLSARGVMSGFAGAKAGQVGPDTSVTRAEFIKMLVVSLDLYDSTATTTYSDVNSNAAWAASYVGSAVDLGIVTDTGSFRPNDAITREEMALYAYRAANKAGISLPTTTAATTFNDASSISSTEMSTAITAMQRAGIIAGEAKNGVATGNFDPQGVTTRAAAAKIISMLMELAY